MSEGFGVRSAFEQADTLASLAYRGHQSMDADALAAALDPENGTPESDGHQPAWNGVLRLFNLVQFLSGRGRSTTAGVGA